MEFDFINKIESCYLAVQDNPALLYYSHIPTAIVSVLMGVFIYFKNRNSLVSKTFLGISLAFSFWTFLDLIVWTNYANYYIMFAWALLGILSSLLFISAFYFFEVSTGSKDISFRKKFILGFLLLPVIIFTPTTLNLSGFDVPNCEALEGRYFTYYYYLLGFVIFVWILFSSIKKIKVATLDTKKQIFLLAFGINLFLLLFFTAGFLTSYLAEKGYVENYDLEQYGLFGMIVFLVFISYLILKYQTFDIKVIAAQFLIVAVWIGVFSQFFIVQERSNQILTGIILALVTYFGWMLFKSVKEEVETSKQLALSSRKLAGLNAKLEELDRAKSEFISIASHQLRTPLTSVKGFTSLILDNTFGKIPIAQKKAVEKIFVNNEKLCLLVEDMLNASRLEAGRLEYELEEVDVVSVVSATVEIIKLYAKSKGVKLIEKYPDEELHAIVDQRKISEIISNLIDNAIKYTPVPSGKGRGPQKSVTVGIEKFRREQKVGKAERTTTVNGHWVRVSVRDSGIGMNEKQLESIFEKFKEGTGDSQSKPVPKPARAQLQTDRQAQNGNGSNGSANMATGTGLGVYISRQMAQAMGGKLFAVSPGKGKGSTFILELPLVKK